MDASLGWHDVNGSLKRGEPLDRPRLFGPPPGLVAGGGAAERVLLGPLLPQPLILLLELSDARILLAVAALPLAAGHQDHADDDAEQEDEADDDPLLVGEGWHGLLRRC